MRAFTDRWWKLRKEQKNNTPTSSDKGNCIIKVRTRKFKKRSYDMRDEAN